jgi:hypothetical protein
LILGLLDQLSHAKVYTKIDLRETYNLVRIRKGDEWKTTLKTRYNHFEYVVMPFGLTIVLAIFQHFMNDVFHEYLDNFMVCYIDDIVIFSKNMEDHEGHVRLVFRSFRGLDFMPNWKSVNSINLKSNSRVMLFQKMALAWIPAKFKPFLIKLLQLLFEMSNVFLDLPTFISVSLPIISFTTVPLLLHLNISKPFVLETNAFNFGVGVVLS